MIDLRETVMMMRILHYRNQLHVNQFYRVLGGCRLSQFKNTPPTLATHIIKQTNKLN